MEHLSPEQELISLLTTIYSFPPEERSARALNMLNTVLREMDELTLLEFRGELNKTIASAKVIALVDDQLVLRKVFSAQLDR